MLSRPGTFRSISGAAASSTGQPDNCLQPTFSYALRAWWAYYWPTSLISLVILVVVEFLLRAGAGLLIPVRALRWVLTILPYLITYSVSIFIIRYLLGKRFRHFRIALLPRAADGPVGPLSPTLRRTIPVWWTFCWRTLVYSLIVWAVTIIPMGFFVGTVSEMGRGEAALARLIAASAIAGAVGMYVIYSNILNEEFGDFRVCLTSLESAGPVPGPLPPTGRSAAGDASRIRGG